MLTSARSVPCFLVEWYRADQPEEWVEAVIDDLETAGDDDACLLMTMSVPSDEVLYALFSARSAEAVSRTCERAGVSPQRITADVGARLGRC
jgi:hypothetical protein